MKVSYPTSTSRPPAKPRPPVDSLKNISGSMDSDNSVGGSPGNDSANHVELGVVAKGKKKAKGKSHDRDEINKYRLVAPALADSSGDRPRPESSLKRKAVGGGDNVDEG